MKSIDPKYHPFIIPGILSLFFIVLELVTANTYGLHTDEYYYIACAYHPAFGYVDHPAFVAWITRAGLLLGTSPYALHLLPALAGAATLLLTAAIVRILGGKNFAAVFSVLSLLSGMYFWVVAGFISMNIYDIFWVSLAAYTCIRILQSPSLSWWLVLGVVIGIGANTKTTMFVFAAGLAAGLLLTRERRFLKTRGPYLTAAIAVVLTAPFLFWQAANHFPTLEFIRNVSASKNAAIVPLNFLLQVIIATGIVTAPVWIAGFCSLFRNRDHGSLRALGAGVAVFILLYLVNKSKFYYIIPVFPLLFAAGAVTVERWTEFRHRWLRSVFIILCSVTIVVWLPLGIPILPIDTFASYASVMGISKSMKTENHKEASGHVLRGIPDYFGQRIGCKEFVADVARVYNTIPEREKPDCAIFGKTYAFAGMVDLYGAEYGLPKAISAHNNYWLWGPGASSGNVLIALGADEHYWKWLYDSVTTAAVYEFPYREDNNRDLKIFICRHPKRPFAEIWNDMKTYD
jgi:hypothetical protein